MNHKRPWLVASETVVGSGIDASPGCDTREGFDRRQDTLPGRNLRQTLSSGPEKGHVVELDPMLDEYYEMVGWDANGVPTRKRLSALGLDRLVE